MNVFAFHIGSIAEYERFSRSFAKFGTEEANGDGQT